MSLRDRLDSIMPGWDRWYPSVFDAAVDLGLLRARVCSPSSLLLSNRHAGVQQEAVQAFREKWYVEDDPLAPQGLEAAETREKPDSGRGGSGDPEQSAARRLLAQALMADIPSLDLADDAPTPQARPRKRRRNRRR
jgi:hypothetical protein